MATAVATEIVAAVIVAAAVVAAIVVAVVASVAAKKEKSSLSPYHGWCYSQTQDSTSSLGV